MKRLTLVLSLCLTLYLVLCFFSVTQAVGTGEHRQTNTAKANPEAEVRQAVENFLEALANFDWKKFRLSFVEDATFFSPGADNFDPSRVRVNGRDAIVAVFERHLKDHPREKGPPYLKTQPKELKIQMLGDAAAVATFHLGGEKTLGRRTLVLQRQQGAWLIAHLHASSIALQK
jgi:ketosteroid isomerase-like protein